MSSMQKLKFRGTPVCRAAGDSSVYESSHKYRLDVLKKNHEENFKDQEQHIAALALTKAKPKYTMIVFGKEVITESKELYETWLRQRTK